MRLAALMVGTGLVAVVAARLLLAGGAAWAVFAFVLPVLLLVLARLLSVGPALLLMGVFVAATLALRALLTAPRLGWALAVLLPVLGLSAFVAVRVGRALRAPKGH